VFVCVFVCVLHECVNCDGMLVNCGALIDCLFSNHSK
jgi:hypothetical protein